LAINLRFVEEQIAEKNLSLGKTSERNKVDFKAATNVSRRMVRVFLAAAAALARLVRGLSK
jgi:hypothetical protein